MTSEVIALIRARTYNLGITTSEGVAMRFVVPVVLLLVAVIHALPAVGVLGAARLEALYGITVRESNLTVLLRHRALLFGLLAAFLAYAAFHPALHRLALVAGMVSVVSFLVIALQADQVNASLATVVRADLLALVLLVVGGVAHSWHPAEA